MRSIRLAPRPSPDTVRLVAVSDGKPRFCGRPRAIHDVSFYVLPVQESDPPARLHAGRSKGLPKAVFRRNLPRTFGSDALLCGSLPFLPELWKSLEAGRFLEDTGVSASGILARYEIASEPIRTLRQPRPAFAAPLAHGRVPRAWRSGLRRVAGLALNEPPLGDARPLTRPRQLSFPSKSHTRRSAAASARLGLRRVRKGS